MTTTMNLSMQSGGFHLKMMKVMRMNGKSGKHISRLQSITCVHSMVPILTSVYLKYFVMRQYSEEHGILVAEIFL